MLNLSFILVYSRPWNMGGSYDTHTSNSSVTEYHTHSWTNIFLSRVNVPNNKKECIQKRRGHIMFNETSLSIGEVNLPKKNRA